MAHRHAWLLWSPLLVACCLSGCSALRVEEDCETEDKLRYLGHAELDYYKQSALEVSYPESDDKPPEEVRIAEKPRTVLDDHKDEIWDATLAETLYLALGNNTIIRSRNQFGSAGNSLYSNPDFAPSIYDPSIQESGVLFGGRGVEAALADFDTQFTSQLVWGRDETVANNQFFSGGLGSGNTVVGETAAFKSELAKQFAHGGLLALHHEWNYLGSNVPGQLFPTSYAGFLQAQYRHPLLAGAGTEYTRIAGPIAGSFGGVTGVSQGVLIARVNNDISIAGFEAHVHELVLDVETLYWDLFEAYRVYDTAVTARNSALRTWREAKAKLDIGGVGTFKPADEAQARDRYFETRTQSQQALSQVYSLETQLRRLVGLPVNDGRILRPVDEPVIAKVHPDWYACLTEALTRRVELRRQKWNVKGLELQLKAAQSQTRPRLDFVSGYQVNGFGDQLFGEQDDDGQTDQGFRSAYETLSQGDQTGWNLGFEMTMPLGFRSARAQVRNIELRLAKARDLLATQEMEISHELAAAFQELASQYVSAQSNFNRRRAAQRRVQLFDAEVQAGTQTLDLLLRAQASLADAEVAYYRSLVGYNKAIANLQFRKGTLLEHNSVYLAESDWSHEAYRDSLRRAWARSHGMDTPFLKTEPEEITWDGHTSELELGSPAHPGPTTDDASDGAWSSSEVPPPPISEAESKPTSQNSAPWPVPPAELQPSANDPTTMSEEFKAPAATPTTSAAPPTTIPKRPANPSAAPSNHGGSNGTGRGSSPKDDNSDEPLTPTEPDDPLKWYPPRRQNPDQTAAQP